MTISKKAIVFGGSRGIGKAIAEELQKLGLEVIALSNKDLDTADVAAMKKFAQKRQNVDVLVINTGGPSKKDFAEISVEEWEKFHKQLFLGFAVLLQNLKINDGGFIFAVTSAHIKAPHLQLILSNVYRVALTSLLKTLSQLLASRQVSVINVAPDTIATDRLKALVGDTAEFSQSLSMKRLGQPEEIGRFVRAIIENDIKYLSGVTVNFDGDGGKFIF